jgi:glycosyltransferase involved in cell wall biosynthesis
MTAWRTGAPEPRIGILVVAYNAESTLAHTLDRIPAEFAERITEILICDDASQDQTTDTGRAWRAEHSGIPTAVIQHIRNLGYGGNQKAGYRMALERGYDIVVLLHADGQYAPESLPDMVAPIVAGEADAVFGSRMLEKGAARRGGMPAYKNVGNRILSWVENRALGSRLSEFHSGYRAYRVAALAELDLRYNTDDFDFDTQIIIQLLDAGKRIVEIPIPTYYGDEICYVNGLRYAGNVVRDVAQYRSSKLGFGTHRWVPFDAEYELKQGEGSSHDVILELMAGRSPARVLDVGCSGGRLGELLRGMGHTVVGVDAVEIEGVRARLDDFHLVDLEDGLPAMLGDDFDVVIAADVIEHVRDPHTLLSQMSARVATDGELIVSTPNFGHWYPRARVVSGTFDYDRRGILDATHYRFFSRASLRRLFAAAGLDLLDLRYTGLPFDVLTRDDSWRSRAARSLDRSLVRSRPTLFAYQFVARLRVHHPGSIAHTD